MRTPEKLRREADALDEVDAGLGASLRSAADQIERLLRQRDELVSILQGISRQIAEVVKAHAPRNDE